eukprot:CAMPEP_0197017290 /NCGR_PEP_ID=MMETSP1380-20130617/79460_1 /TAXON_ID=5936 /ORGANISM="Euplotes crassus, Strain CT5" /LENGTH=212 /DNA_ID=CAMNT_0042444375 /DNA_START=625 /DNA_END=1261 /DNA_ORIENTATION=-
MNWKQFECELCKMPYPYCFKYLGERWNLVDLKRPKDNETPFIILESLNSEKNSSRTIHTVVIKSDKRIFQLGRGHDSDLRINDISVSRRHAALEYREDGFYIVDYQSKFGTLVLESGNVEIKEDTHQTIQVGRTIITVKVRTESKVPEFLTQNMSKNNQVKFDPDFEDKEYKVIEIKGKRYLIKPESPNNDPTPNEECMGFDEDHKEEYENT